ncbi:NUDIX hydrolase [Thecamonas trahens ATCC 50062]|uniref:NUDIX hydrolase n=1 Tax=Thecamonas trahens ATCC 50062 TaxID=461836 RepID=A0A0L0DBQ0_THETB|nr:NUDIX hydrolase [Thecamonas trahens ATCC 50062]KNC49767.1 NUDIX hydrolase [Thecamonas trahens ATCC 50062]|eukprot:XP_013757552.1 NUDIX hydrolase [Thecamonas trahens ATCC 50062]
MRIIYAQEPYPETTEPGAIFLAGPTVRLDKTPHLTSWRVEAVARLEELGFQGDVYVPEESPEMAASNVNIFEGYADQVEWEESGIARADVVVFWIPRDLVTLPGLTTNDEWGGLKMSGRAMLGAPPDAPKTGYQLYYARKYGAPAFDNLSDLLAAAVAAIGRGARRVGGDASAPLLLWRSPAFRAWHKALGSAGNELRDLRIEWVAPIGSSAPEFFGISASVFVAADDAVVTQTVVLRPDIDALVLLTDEHAPRVALITGPIATLTGDPGVGTSLGIKLDPSRLVRVGSGALASAAATSGQAHVFGYKLRSSEAEAVEAGGRRLVEMPTGWTWPPSA